MGEKAVERGMAAQVLERWVHRAKCARYNKNEGLGTAYPPFETEIGINPVIKGAFLSDDDLTSITRQVHNTGDFEVFGDPNVGDIEAKPAYTFQEVLRVIQLIGRLFWLRPSVYIP